MSNNPVKTKEEIKKQCNDFLDKNNYRMQVVPVYSDYGDREVEGYEIYLVPKNGGDFFNSEVRKNGIFLQQCN